MDRPRYWSPMVAGDIGEEGIFAVYLPQLGVIRQYSQALMARIYIKDADGNGQGAVRDLIAIRKFTALMRNDPTLIGGLVGISLDGLALDTTKVLLKSHELDEDDLALLTQLWNDRVDYFTLSELMDVGERIMGLDLLQLVWMGRIEDNVVSAFGFGNSEISGRRLRSARFDINRALRTLNRHYDSEVRIMRIEPYAEWKQRHDVWDEQWQSDHAVINQDGLGIARTLGWAAMSSDGYTDLLTSMYINAIMPSIGAVRQTEFRLGAHDTVVYIALQCERYRLANGEVPATLEALVPDYLDEVPIDPMDGEPMRYIVTDTGYTIYSIGTDLEDDGGVHDFREGDIAVTIELPAD